LGVPVSSTLQSRKLAPNPRIVVAAPSYIAWHGAPERPSDLHAHNCLTLGETRSWTMAASDGTVTETKVQGNFTTNYAEAVTEGVLSGIGIARKCQWEIAEHLEAGTLVPVLENYTILPEWNVFALRPPAQQAPARVRIFTDFLKSKYAEFA
jgi:DNA-binding transcriptional LysR family regulator